MAKYDFKKPNRVANARKYLERAIKNEEFVEIRKIDTKSLSLNGYFHLIVTYYAMKTGYTIKKTREEFIKEDLCRDIFVVERPNPVTGEMYDHVRGWADLNSHEAHTVVSRFLNYSSNVAGIRLPEPSDLVYPEIRREIETEIEQAKEFLY